MNKRFDLSVYCVVDPSCCAGRPIEDIVLAAARGGATLIQYRNKSSTMSAIMAEAALLCELLKPYHIPLIINDYIHVAFAVGAAGVHLGQGDEPPARARAQLGAAAIIGQTAFTADHIHALDPAVDYIGTGPFYETKTAKGKPVLGAEIFFELAAGSPVPVVGIGGITPENAAAVIAAGASGVAMMRAISEADDPEQAAQRFKIAVENARQGRAA